MVPPKVTLVDLGNALTGAAHAAGWTEVDLHAEKDIRDVPRRPGVAFVSPANSLGFMDGGLDLALTRMFPGIEADVKRAIVERGRRTILGRPYLPIGEALVVPTCEPGVHVVSAPTMWLPQDVSGTHNPYHAMYAALREAAAHPEIDHVVAPGLCTGYGKVGGHDAVRLMAQAHRDVLHGRPPRWDAAAIEREQPKYYMNTEFAHMDFSQVRHV